MVAWTLEEARTNLNRWLEAEAAVALGQAYTIGDRSLTRADLSQIAKRIDFWRNEVETLEKDMLNGGRFCKRIIPLDF